MDAWSLLDIFMNVLERALGSGGVKLPPLRATPEMDGFIINGKKHVIYQRRMRDVILADSARPLQQNRILIISSDCTEETFKLEAN